MTAASIHRGPFQASELPEGALIVLVGISGSGKSTLAKSLVPETSIVSSDRLRGWISDDEGDQTVSEQAFDLLYRVVAMRLAIGRTTVVDATSVTQRARAVLVELARRAGRSAVAIVLDVDLEECIRRDAARTDRSIGRDVIAEQRRSLDASLPGIGDEGFEEIRFLALNDQSRER